MIFQRQVVYLTTSPLSKRDYDRFGIQRWLDRGWDVKVFDFTKFLKPEHWSYVNGDKLSFYFDGLKIIEDENSALKLIENLEDKTVFIDLISSSSTEQKIRQTAQRKGVTLKCNLGSYPIERYDKPKMFRIIQKILKHPSSVFTAILNKIRQYQEVPPNYWVVGGTAYTLYTPLTSQFNASAI